MAVLIVSIMVSLNISQENAEKERPKEPLLTSYVAGTRLATSAVGIVEAAKDLGNLVNEIQGSTGNDVGFYVQTVDGSTLLAYNENKKFYSASSIKGPYILSVASSTDDLVNSSQRENVELAIEESVNEAYFQVKSKFGVKTINQWLAESDSTDKIAKDSYSFLNISPKQLAGLWQEAWDYVYYDDSETKQWLEIVFSDPLNSKIANIENAVTWSKPGWIRESDISSTVDAGIVISDESAYIISVMTNKGYDFSIITRLVNAIDRYMRYVPNSVIGISPIDDGSVSYSVANSASSTESERVETVDVEYADASEIEVVESNTEVNTDANENDTSLVVRKKS